MTVESRGTSNTNDRGSAEARRQRKRWLFETWGADVDVVTPAEMDDLDYEFFMDGLDDLSRVGLFTAFITDGVYVLPKGLGRPAVRCFRCGRLLDWDSVEIDRIKPGCEGGRYHKNNIRPVCGPCNKVLAGEYVRKRNAKRKKRNEQARARRRDAKQTAYAALNHLG